MRARASIRMRGAEAAAAVIAASDDNGADDGASECGEERRACGNDGTSRPWTRTERASTFPQAVFQVFTNGLPYRNQIPTATLNDLAVWYAPAAMGCPKFGPLRQ